MSSFNGSRFQSIVSCVANDRTLRAQPFRRTQRPSQAVFHFTRSSCSAELTPAEFGTWFTAEARRADQRSDSRLYYSWRRSMLALLVLDLWVIPFELLVMPDALSLTVVVVFGWLTSVLFLVDLCVLFRSMRSQKWVKNWWIVAELVGVLAFPFATLSNNRAFILLRLARVLRTFSRPARLRKRQWELQWRSVLKVVGMVHVLLLYFHWTSFGWLAVGLADYYCHVEATCWTIRSKRTDRWDLYSQALEWSFQVMKPNAGNNLERLYTMFIIILSAIAIGSGMALLQSSFLDTERRRGQVSARVTEVSSFLRRRGVPASLQEAVEAYLRAVHSDANSQAVDLVRDLSANQLRDVCISMYERHLTRFRFFVDELGKKFIEALCEVVQERRCVPQEVVVSQNQVMNELLFLVEGVMYGYHLKSTNTLDRRSTEHFSGVEQKLSTLSLDDQQRKRTAVQMTYEAQPKFEAGTWIGEMALFSNNDIVPKWDATYQAFTFSLFLSVRRKAFDMLLSNNEDWQADVMARRQAIAQGEVTPDVFGCRRCGGDHDAKEACHLARWSMREGFWHLEGTRNLSSEADISESKRSANEHAFMEQVSLVESCKVEMYLKRIISDDIEAADVDTSIQSIYPEVGFYDVDDPVQRQLRDRTIGSILCVFWTLCDRRLEFIGSQQEGGQLHRESWESIRELVTSAEISIENWYELDYILISLIMRFLSRLTAWRTTFASGIADPDTAAAIALDQNVKASPSFTRLCENGRNRVLAILGLNANFNLAQLLQAECLPSSLAFFERYVYKFGIVAQRRYEFTWLCEMSSLIEKKPLVNGCLFMTERMYQSIRLVLSSLSALAEVGHETSYRRYLEIRAVGQQLSMHTVKEHAIVRVACFLRCYTGAAAQEVQDAFSELRSIEHDQLVDFLIQAARPAVMLMFAPDLMLSVQKNSKLSLVSGLRVMLQAFQIASQEFSAHEYATIICKELSKLASLAQSDGHFMRCAKSMKLQSDRHREQAVLIIGRHIWEELEATTKLETETHLTHGNALETELEPLRDAQTASLLLRCEQLRGRINAHQEEVASAVEKIDARQSRQEQMLEQMRDAFRRLAERNADRKGSQDQEGGSLTRLATST